MWEGEMLEGKRKCERERKWPAREGERGKEIGRGTEWHRERETVSSRWGEKNDRPGKTSKKEKISGK